MGTSSEIVEHVDIAAFTPFPSSSSYNYVIIDNDEYSHLNTNIPSTNTSKPDYTCVSITAPVHERILHTKTARRDPKIIPNEFEDWIQSNGGEKDFSLLINRKVTRRKRKSLLSNVSYPSFSDDRSTSSSDEDSETDYIPPDVQNNELHKNEAPQPPLIPPASKSTSVKRPSSWLSGLFQKQQANDSNAKPVSKSKKNIFNFFSSKKPKQQQPSLPQKKSQVQPKGLPKRYPMPIERVIYQIAFIKLKNPKRPLQHQVVVSNMIHWYTTVITKEASTCKRHQLYLQKSLSL